MTADIELLDYTIEEIDNAKLICLSGAENVNSDPDTRFTMPKEHCEWIRIEPGKKGRLVLAGTGEMVRVFNADEWPDVRKTGMNPKAQSAEVQFYEKALETLLGASRAARKDALEWERRRALSQNGEPLP